MIDLQKKYMRAANKKFPNFFLEIKYKKQEKVPNSKQAFSLLDLQKMKMNEAIIMRSRLNPFKTKLKPSYEIDWGNNYPEAEFISREKGEIGLFDLKTFVNENLQFEDPQTGKQTPLLIAGCSGTSRYNNGLCQFTDRQMKFKLLKMVPKLIYNKLKYGRYLDIFMTHASPRHIHDHEDPCHLGFNCYNWFLERFKPTYLVHGHIHLYDLREERVGKYFDTTVVNAYAHYVIELPMKTTQKKDN